MYTRSSRIFFGFMAFVMVVGYPVLLLTAIPSFQSAFLGQQSGEGATRSQIEDAYETVDEKNCLAKKRPKGKALTECKDALKALGSGYQALSFPDEEQQLAGEQPALVDEKSNKAQEAYELLVRLDPEDEENQQLLAGSYANRGKYNQALPIYEALLKENPDDADLVFAAASTAQAAGKNDQAKAGFKKFLKLAPDDQRAESAQEAIKQIDNPQSASSGLEGLNLG